MFSSRAVVFEQYLIRAGIPMRRKSYNPIGIERVENVKEKKIYSVFTRAHTITFNTIYFIKNTAKLIDIWHARRRN